MPTPSPGITVEYYKVNLPEGYVAIPAMPPGLGGEDVRSINHYLGKHGYALADPFRVEPVLLEDEVRFAIVRLDQASGGSR